MHRCDGTMTRAGRRGAAALAVAGGLLLASAATPALAATSGTAAAVPAVKHVWQVQLENEDFSRSFPGTGTTLDRLAAQGVFLSQYYGTGHNSLDNYLAQVAGQAQFSSTSQDCPVYKDTGGTVDAKGFYQPITPQDTGCVYPSSVKTLADQLTAAGRTWHGYEQDMGNTASRETSPCGQPAAAPGVAVNPTVGAPDQTEVSTAADQYAARHNPFAYFHSLIDAPGGVGSTTPSPCQANVTPLSTLAGDLASSASSPTYSFITPNLCDDGHDAPCRGPGAEGANPGAGGLVSANAFLAKLVTQIQASPAYADGGLIVVTFDEAGTDSSSCCGQSGQPGVAASGGGGRVGAVLLSQTLTPHVSNVAYNHYSFLRTYEDIFGLTRSTPGPTGGLNGSDGLGHLAHAGDAGLVDFTPELTGGSAGGTQAPVVPEAGHVALLAVLGLAAGGAALWLVRRRRPAGRLG